MMHPMHCVQADDSKTSLDTASCNMRPFSSLITKLINCFHHLEQVCKHVSSFRIVSRVLEHILTDKHTISAICLSFFSKY